MNDFLLQSFPSNNPDVPWSRFAHGNMIFWPWALGGFPSFSNQGRQGVVTFFRIEETGLAAPLSHYSWGCFPIFFSPYCYRSYLFPTFPISKPWPRSIPRPESRHWRRTSSTSVPSVGNIVRGPRRRNTNHWQHSIDINGCPINKTPIYIYILVIQI